MSTGYPGQFLLTNVIGEKHHSLSCVISANVKDE